MYAHFEVRRKDLTAARKVLGQAIGRCPKDRLFKVRCQLFYVPLHECNTVFSCGSLFEIC